MSYLELNKKDNKSNDDMSIKKKIIVLIIAVSLAISIFTIRLFYLQIIRNQYYDKLARNNKEQIVPVTAFRGEVYDRNGIPVVENIKTYTLSIIPVYLPKNYFEREELLHRVAKEFSLDLGYIKNAVKKVGNYSYETIEITDDITMKEISFLAENSHLYPGVYYGSKAIRRYPLGDTMTHVLGYVGNISPDEYEAKREEGYRHDSLVGKEGVELFYDKELRGIDGYVQWIVDSRSRVQQVLTPASGNPVPGKKLILTIDSKIQRDAENLLRDINGTIIVSRPATGEILAMVSSPWYDPNIFIGGINKNEYSKLINDPNHPFWNKAIRGRYAPGSTFKLVSAVGALHEGKINSKTYKYCNGGMLLENRFYRCTGRHGSLNIYKAIQYSCNTYFYELGYEVGPNFLKKYSEILGIGDYTGVDLPGEKLSTIPSADWKRRRIGEYWWDGDTIQYVMGQGYINVTPIALHNMTSTIVNEGTLYKPHVVKEIRSSQTDEIILNNDGILVNDTQIDPYIYRIVKKGMRLVVESGTARTGAWSPNLRIAAKTGTTENDQGRDHSWTTAFAPYSDGPNDEIIAVTVLLEHRGGGGLNAAPIATAMLRSIFLEEDPVDVRDSIYSRMNTIRQRGREQRALQNLQIQKAQEKLEAQKLEAQKLEAQKLEAQKLETQN